MSQASGEFEFSEINGDGKLARFERLAGRAFGVPDGQSFFDDFPIWKTPVNTELRRAGAWVGDELASAACARLVSLKTPVGAFRAVIIGGVCTDERWRGRGLASTMVGGVLDWSRDRGALCAFLWGSAHALYERLAFRLCGSQVRVPLASLDLPPIRKDLRPGTGYRPEIFAWLKARRDGMLLCDSDQDWIARHRNVEWHWVAGTQGVRAYVAIGRGIDLQGIIHEWGGEPDALRQLLAEVRAHKDGLELIGSPRICTQYKLKYSSSAIECLCLCRVFDPVRTAAAFGVAAASEEFGSDDACWPAMLFGPRGDDRAGLPLPLWIWGLDSA